MPDKKTDKRRTSERRRRVNNHPATTAIIEQVQSQPLDVDKEYWQLLHEMRPLHRRFVEEYLIDFNGAAAMRRAGFKVGSSASGSVGAHRLLQRANVARAVEIGKQAYARRAEVTKERIEAELAMLAFSNMEDYIQVNDKGEPVINLSMLTRDSAAALQEISVVKGRKGRKTIRIKLYDKKAALEALAKSKGYVKEPDATSRDFTFHVVYDELPSGAVDGDFREIQNK